MANPLAGHTNSYHTYSHDEALQGIAEAGYSAVELSAVPGWTEHVDLDADQGELRRKLEGYGLEPVSLSAHSDLTTADGLAHGIKAVRWAADYGIPIVNTAVGGHQSADENEAAFLANIGAMADEAERAGIAIGLEIHGDIMASGAVTLPLLEKIGRESVGINYDTANVVYYSGDTAVEDLPKVVDKLVHVHLKESKGGKGVWDFGEIGTGDVDFAGVLRILGDAGYDGPYSVEVEFSGEPWPPLAEVNAPARAIEEDLDLHVARPVEVPLEQEAIVPEGSGRLAARAAEELPQVRRDSRHVHALAASTRDGLDQHGVADRVRFPRERTIGLRATVAAR